jgi:hypothetical protein
MAQYAVLSGVLFSGFQPDSGFQRIPEQINLALEWLNSDLCSAEYEKILGNPRIPEDEARQELKKKMDCTAAGAIQSEKSPDGVIRWLPE